MSRKGLEMYMYVREIRKSKKENEKAREKRVERKEMDGTAL